MHAKKEDGIRIASASPDSEENLFPKISPRPPQQDSPDSASGNLGLAFATVVVNGRVLAADNHFAQFLLPGANGTLVGSYLEKFVSPPSWPVLAEALRAGARHPSVGELTVLQPDLGRQRTIRLSFNPSANGNRKAVSVIAVDISELASAAAELDEARIAITSMSARSILASAPRHRP